MIALFTTAERQKIEEMAKTNKVADIARALGRSTTSIYVELRRGYSAEKAERTAEAESKIFQKIRKEKRKGNEACFADRGKRCAILKTKDCKHCNFFKTPEKFTSDRLKYAELEAEFIRRKEKEKREGKEKNESLQK